MQASCSVFDELQHLVQQFSRPTHKGFPLQIFLLAGAFPDAHDLRRPIAHAEHNVVSGVRQGAPLTSLAALFQPVPLQHCHFSESSVFTVFHIIPHWTKQEKRQLS
jgi:hypothetical protein